MTQCGMQDMSFFVSWCGKNITSGDSLFRVLTCCEPQGHWLRHWQPNSNRVLTSFSNGCLKFGSRRKLVNIHNYELEFPRLIMQRQMQIEIKSIPSGMQGTLKKQYQNESYFNRGRKQCSYLTLRVLMIKSKLKPASNQAARNES